MRRIFHIKWKSKINEWCWKEIKKRIICISTNIFRNDRIYIHIYIYMAYIQLYTIIRVWSLWEANNTFPMLWANYICNIMIWSVVKDLGKINAFFYITWYSSMTHNKTKRILISYMSMKIHILSGTTLWAKI